MDNSESEKAKEIILLLKSISNIGGKLMMTIRVIEPHEYVFLEEMLYEAIYIPEGSGPLPKDIIRVPDLMRYIEDFGRKEDCCLVAEVEGKCIGAIWTRVFDKESKGYGYVDECTPELSMALDKTYRGHGIGTKMIRQMLELLKTLEYAQVSLSVDERNRAFNLYEKFGFETVSSHEGSHIMVKKLL